jgi:hypothetical protein
MKQDDWRLFREKLPSWQEAYMNRLNKEYIELLSGNGNPSDKFWALDKRMKEDKRSPGVQLEMRKSDLLIDLIALLRHGVIGLDDLQEFSDEFKMQVSRIDL